MTRAMLDRRPEAGTGSRELRYEGFPLEAVLARVHAAHGADVTITAADRVRRGGIGGFFAKELFQVTVTVPAPADDGDAELNFVPLGRMSIFGDDAVSDLEVIGDEPDYDEIDPEDVAGALSLEPAPVRDDADAEIWALLAKAAVSTPPAPAAPQVQASVPVPLPVPVAVPAPVPVPVPVPAAGTIAPAVVAPVAQQPEIVAPIHSAGPIASTTLIPASSVVGTPFDPAQVTPPFPGVAPAAVRLPVTTTLPVSAEAAGSTGTIRAGARVDLNGLIARFETVPPAPPLPTAGIVAVIGSRTEALEVAGGLAARLGIPTDDVIVASPPADVVVPTPEDAMRLAATTRYRCAPVAVIVLELVPGRQGHEWVRVVLDGLRAEQVRLAADTTRLIAHQHLSIAAVGGVDVIDLLGAAEHPAPDDALQLPTPVASIDGRPATPELWAATVLAGRATSGATVDRSGVTGR